MLDKLHSDWSLVRSNSNTRGVAKKLLLHPGPDNIMLFSRNEGGGNKGEMGGGDGGRWGVT